MKAFTAALMLAAIIASQALVQPASASPDDFYFYNSPYGCYVGYPCPDWYRGGDNR
jgi:hypothetical protein